MREETITLQIHLKMRRKKDINKEYTNISTTEDLGMTKTELRDFSHPNTEHTKLCSNKLPN